VLAGARLVTRSSALQIRVAPVAAVIGCAVLLQLATHAYLYGRPTLTGSDVPFLLARAIGDGTVEPYLRSVCGKRSFALCEFLDRLPCDVDTFIWSERGVWKTATPEQRRRMLDEEARLLRAAIQARPLEQLRASLKNFAVQLVHFEIRDLDRHPAIDAQVNTSVVATAAGYFTSRQAQGRLHLRAFGGVIYVVVGLSILVAALAAWRLSARWPADLGPFAGLVSTGIIANAVITGALSGLNPRYQARVIWLVPLIAYVLAVAWWDAREIPGKKRTGQCGLSGSEEET
jgi:hypothetical protein